MFEGSWFSMALFLFKRPFDACLLRRGMAASVPSAALVFLRGRPGRGLLIDGSRQGQVSLGRQAAFLQGKGGDIFAPGFRRKDGLFRNVSCEVPGASFREWGRTSYRRLGSKERGAAGCSLSVRDCLSVFCPGDGRSPGLVALSRKNAELRSGKASGQDGGMTAFGGAEKKSCRAGRDPVPFFPLCGARDGRYSWACFGVRKKGGGGQDRAAFVREKCFAAAKAAAEGMVSPAVFTEYFCRRSSGGRPV